MSFLSDILLSFALQFFNSKLLIVLHIWSHVMVIVMFFEFSENCFLHFICYTSICKFNPHQLFLVRKRDVDCHLPQCLHGIQV